MPAEEKVEQNWSITQFDRVFYTLITAIGAPLLLVMLMLSLGLTADSFPGMLGGFSALAGGLAIAVALYWALGRYAVDERGQNSV